MVTNANLFIRDSLVGLTKEYRSNELIINYIYKFKIF